MGRRRPVIVHQHVTQNIVAPVRNPVRTADSLASKQHLSFFDLVSEGEIEGFATPSRLGLTPGTAAYTNAALKDIYLNGTSVLTAGADVNSPTDGDFNFKEVGLQFRLGTQSQTYIPSFLDFEQADNLNPSVNPLSSGGTPSLSSAVGPETEFSVNTEVQSGTPITVTITSQNVDAVRLTLTVPALQSFSSQGDIYGASVEFTVAVYYSGGSAPSTAWEDKLSDQITGRTADRYQRSYRIDLADTNWSSVDIRVTKSTADSTDQTSLQNSLVWSSYTELIYEKLRYPHSAIVALRLDSEQLSSIPARSYKLRGKKVKIPNGVTVDNDNGRIVYPAGYIFDGTLSSAKAWTSDPAWVLFDVLTSRSGFGSHISESDLDLFAFYAASKYSSELVNDSSGGLEPRFSCNVLLSNGDEAFRLINDLSSVMRCMPYWSSGSLTISQDSPQDAAYLFTQANVSDKGFNYKGTSIKARHTVCVVSYLDTESQEIAYEVVEDHAAIAKFGVVQTEIKAFACTSRGQAKRLGEWLLYSEAQEGQVISFESSADAASVLRPGHVIEVADRMRSVSRRGGRLVSASSSLVTIDDTSETDVVFTTGTVATLSVVLPDGSVESREVTGSNGAQLNLASPFSTTPAQNAVWLLETTGGEVLQPSTWRIVSIEEKEPHLYLFNAVSYNASKYNHIERGEALQNRNITVTEYAPAAPGTISGESRFYVVGELLLQKIKLAWEPVAGVSSYQVRYRYQQQNWVTFEVVGPSADILEATEGNYEIEIKSLNATGRPSNATSALTYQHSGNPSLPDDVTGASLLPISDTQAIITWNRSTQQEIVLAGSVIIRHSSATGGAANFASAQDVAVVVGSQTQKVVPLLDGTYFLKFQIGTGGTAKRSETAAALPVTAPQVQQSKLISTVAEETGFSGTLSNMSALAVGGTPGIALAAAGLIDEVVNPPGVDLIGNMDLLGGVAPSGSYEFSTAGLLTLAGGVFDVNLKRRITSNPYIANDYIDTWPNPPGIDAREKFDGIEGQNINAKLFVSSSIDGVTYSAFSELQNAVVRGQHFKFKLQATSAATNENVHISQLGAFAYLAARTEQNSATGAAGAQAVNFGSAFYEPPTISAAINDTNMQSGDFVTVSSVTRTGFSFTCTTSAGQSVARDIIYTASGHGAQV